MRLSVQSYGYHFWLISHNGLIQDHGAYKDSRFASLHTCIHISKKQTTKDNHVSTLTIVNCRLLKMSFPASYNGTFWLLICCTILLMLLNSSCHQLTNVSNLITILVFVNMV
jgi:hypothetical protein